MNLEILKKTPSLDTEVLLNIRPLAPLSMASEMPGSYYKTLRDPSKKMLCGLFENILDWQLSVEDRKNIWKDYKKTKKNEHSQGSTYWPLLMDFFDIDGEVEIREFKSLCIYKDLWNKNYRRIDSPQKHINGCRNKSVDILEEYYDKKAEATQSKKDKKFDAWLKDHIGHFPYFYTSPTAREFISLDGYYQIHLHMDRQLYNMLKDIQERRNIGYLGTTEGWVDVYLRLL